ncbi:DUF3592 domain-containing protein [Mesorhizobium sp.]|uniref:DUF3592 domain-containing protein n=1 Tax=Mesorhizobium sp. TaxID=1871066 RepID=UPI000FEA100A|nr:DUF3592 domain-containing protein [Mesorhizobium sp.]RWK49580.1 MAG: hypothetical protein EOR48_28605 [Mesorhizobium sp.]TIP42305.1 MAG: hypothetical protein E5X62_22525 [Mesorhizobium sp.]
MEQSWNSFWGSVSQAFHLALSPLRALAETFGYFPSDIQLWCFVCGLFFLVLVVPHTYGDLVLRHRRVYVTGKVVEIKMSDDSPRTPTIEFADRLGKIWRFESHLQVNKTTGSVGAAVKVMYDPLHPNRARELGRPIMKATHTAVWYAIIVGLMALAFWPGLTSD